VVSHFKSGFALLAVRTPVPKEESLASLASHKATMAIFLSVHKIGEVVEELLNHYEKETPVAVVQKATWKDEKIVIGTLDNIEKLVKEANITKTAQILVGNFLGDKYSLSKLYDKEFTHEYRIGRKDE
jgi:precorrin-4/cobalt-precorrin-4 C11-methyltransferase